MVKKHELASATLGMNHVFKSGLVLAKKGGGQENGATILAVWLI